MSALNAKSPTLEVIDNVVLELLLLTSNSRKRISRNNKTITKTRMKKTRRRGKP
jgi:hypothetical protein